MAWKNEVLQQRGKISIVVGQIAIIVIGKVGKVSIRNRQLICSVLLLCPHFALDVFQWPNAWSVHWTLDREVWVRDLTGLTGSALAWARHFSLPCHFAPKSINEYQQIVREAWWNAGGDLAMDWQLMGRGGEGIVILLFMLKWNRDKFLLSGSICSSMEPRKANFNLVKLFYGQGFLLYP